MRRVIWTQLLISLLGALLIAGVLRYVVHHEVDELMDQGLRESAEILQSTLSIIRKQGSAQSVAQSHAEYEEHLVWQIVDIQSGGLLDQSHKAPLHPLVTTPAKELMTTPDEAWRVITYQSKTEPGTFLLVAQSTSERVEARSEVTTYTLIGALAMGLLATGLLHLLIRRELKPLTNLSETVKRLDPTRPETLPPPADRAELVPMVNALKELGKRLEQRINTERTFNAHAAHALRTPLAGIDAQLAVALIEAPASLRPRLIRSREAAKKLSQVMQALLIMFRSGSEPQRQSIKVSELVKTMLPDSLVLNIIRDSPLQADPDLLSAVLFNLLDNARRHKASHVELRAWKQAGVNGLRIEDDGEGCTQEHLTQLRSALDRHDYSAESGLNGLGLILADMVVKAHGGRLELVPVAKGFCIELTWPDQPM